ncbi:MAG: cation transporter [Candidatus Omnitrophica bacterium]|nr:cation transporter [Candidatus Omnitrophota bacterium]
MGFAEEQKRLRQKDKKALWISAALTLVFMCLEFAGGLWARSLALLADAGHMFTDFFALSFAILAFWMAERPPTQRMSYGFHRAEILAALANGVILINVVIHIFSSSVQRFFAPVPVASGTMLVFAVAGLAVNLICAFVLKRTGSRNLNLQGAFFHVMADLVGSLGVLSAGWIIRVFGWHLADALAGMGISVLIIFSAGKLLKDSVSILLEAAPLHIDLEDLENSLRSVPGVKNVHDLHVWTISSGQETLSAHLDVEKNVPPDDILRQVTRLLEDRFGIYHSTVQLETVDHPGHLSRF